MRPYGTLRSALLHCLRNVDRHFFTKCKYLHSLPKFSFFIKFCIFYQNFNFLPKFVFFRNFFIFFQNFYILPKLVSTTRIWPILKKYSLIINSNFKLSKKCQSTEPMFELIEIAIREKKWQEIFHVFVILNFFQTFFSNVISPNSRKSV